MQADGIAAEIEQAERSLPEGLRLHNFGDGLRVVPIHDDGPLNGPFLVSLSLAVERVGDRTVLRHSSFTMKTLKPGDLAATIAKLAQTIQETA